MGFFGDIGNDISKSVKESYDAAKQTVKENINTQLNKALSNTRRTAIQRPKRGYYSGIDMYGAVSRTIARKQNFYQDTTEKAYVVPVINYDDYLKGLEDSQSAVRYDLRSGLYADEYNSIASEFDMQYGN